MSEDQSTPDQPDDDPARAFGAVARTYDRARPDYPADAVAWLCDGEAKVVLELGAGTGKLTADLVAAGHAVYATDPDAAMLEILTANVPQCSARQAGAEEIPANDRTVDVVLAAQSFHWFDPQIALPEIARVLKPHGHLALAWNVLDQRIPWVRRLVELLGEKSTRTEAADVLHDSDLFGEVEHRVFAHWQDVDRSTLIDMAASRSWIAMMPEAEREQRLFAVGALYDEYGRGHDGMQLPYRTECFRARLIADESGNPAGTPVVSDGTDTDTLLIDFR